MKILSRYLVLEYLLWVKNNHYLVDNRNENFCKLLDSDYQTLQVFDNETPSRNLIFKFHLKNKQYVFKQYGPDIINRKKYFEAEQFALNTNTDSKFCPTIVYQDKLANIIITEELIEYNNFTKTLSNLAEAIPEDADIKRLIAETAEAVKILHTFNISQDDTSPYVLEDLNDFLSNKPELWNNNLTVQFIAYRKKSCFTHLDLKANNIFLKNGDIKILDWEMSAKGDPYFDLCSIIFEICSVLISPNFLSEQINVENSMVKYAKKYIKIFMDKYQVGQTIIDRDKLHVFFTILFFEKKINNQYEGNIKLFLPFSQ